MDCHAGPASRDSSWFFCWLFGHFFFDRLFRRSRHELQRDIELLLDERFDDRPDGSHRVLMAILVERPGYDERGAGWPATASLVLSGKP